MMAVLRVSLLLLAIAGPAKAQDMADLKGRMVAFQNAQVACKAIFLLGTAKMTESFLAATGSSLSDVCECAALKTVVGKSTDQIAALASGEQSVAEQMAREVRTHLPQCIAR
jgi:ABC-type nitrate/sulfonate/bicarbonate transport system substrate-binding protein